MKILFSLFVALFLLAGCGETPKPVEPKPDWISNHSVGAVGMCATHLRGNAVQEEAAHDRALKMLAKVKAASIETASIGSQHEAAGRYSSTFDTQTSVSANVNNISARIEKTWRNPKNNDFYIWLIPNN